MTRFVLAGDVGGTKTDLAIVEAEGRDHPTIVREATYRSLDFAGLAPMVVDFLAVGAERLAAAAFGVPGPVLGDEAAPVNLPWRIRRRDLAAACGCDAVRLLNDMETTALGILKLGPGDVRVLQPGRERPGHRAVLAAGTGLGQGLLVRDGDRWLPVATEGGHADFAPPGEREVELLRFLRREQPRVSWERVVSGPGLLRLFRFVTEADGVRADPQVLRRAAEGGSAAVVGDAAATGTCPASRAAVDWWLRLYAAQAGNLALTAFATGGVYLAGGIIRKLLPCLDAASMVASFRTREAFEEFLSEAPLQVVLHPKVGLLGAAAAAA